MAELNRAGRYDLLADGVERVTGRPAMSVREFVSLHANEFGGRRSAAHADPRRSLRSLSRLPLNGDIVGRITTVAERIVR